MSSNLTKFTELESKMVQLKTDLNKEHVKILRLQLKTLKLTDKYIENKIIKPSIISRMKYKLFALTKFRKIRKINII
jgi:hypothetical protein